MEDRPLQFIYPHEGKLELNKETADIIANITTPIKVITVAGNYRTGKSYLLNRYFRMSNSLIPNKETGYSNNKMALTLALQ
jgi:hypothetical protein